MRSQIKFVLYNNQLHSDIELITLLLEYCNIIANIIQLLSSIKHFARCPNPTGGAFRASARLLQDG